jgi:DNA (cytosine-5)-methyltransferase 1
MTAYYNEIDPFAAAWLRNLIKAGHIAPGDVDARSIVDVGPDDLRGYAQCHFFAGIAGWSAALRMAGWADDREIWTGSCPCQPFSAAGKQRGEADERHLWPEFARLIRECRPSVVAGEQVASALGRTWLGAVRADLEGMGYAVGAADLCAAGVGAPHIRQRLWWVADAERGAAERHGHPMGAAQGRDEGTGGERQRLRPDAGDGGVAFPLAGRIGARLEGRDARPLGDERATAERGGAAGFVGDAWGDGRGQGRRDAAGGDAARGGWEANGRRDAGTHDGWSDLAWLSCRDGKARPTQSGIQPLVNGVSGRVAVERPIGQGDPAVQEAVRWVSRVGALRGAGNAIVPQVAAEFVSAFMECRP